MQARTTQWTVGAIGVLIAGCVAMPSKVSQEGTIRNKPSSVTTVKQPSPGLAASKAPSSASPSASLAPSTPVSTRPTTSPRASASASPRASASPTTTTGGGTAAALTPNTGPLTPGPTDPADVQAFYPFIDGASWAFRLVSKQNRQTYSGTYLEITFVLSDVAKTATGFTATETSTLRSVGLPMTGAGNPPIVAKLELKDGVFTRRLASGKLEMMLKLPLTVGQSWTAENQTFSVEAREDVATVAGRVTNAFKIRRVDPTSAYHIYDWYSPGQGNIQHETIQIAKPTFDDIYDLLTFTKPTAP